MASQVLLKNTFDKNVTHSVMTCGCTQTSLISSITVDYFCGFENKSVEKSPAKCQTFLNRYTNVND